LQANPLWRATLLRADLEEVAMVVAAVMVVEEPRVAVQVTAPNERSILKKLFW
jgi:hypothetical protein